LFSTEQVETLLKTQDPAALTPEITSTSFTAGQTSTSSANIGSIPANDFGLQNPTIGLNSDRWGFNGESPQPGLDPMAFSADLNMGMGLDDNTFTWEMIGLGLEEPLPPQDRLSRHQIYFDKIHPSLPMIHKYRYLAAMNL
jgi:hypothetical protein